MIQTFNIYDPIKRLASHCYKLKPLSLFISLLLMLKKIFDNVRIEKQKVKVVLA